MKTYYCVKNPEGELLTFTSSESEEDTINIFNNLPDFIYTCETTEGHEIVKVRIEEVEG